MKKLIPIVLVFVLISNILLPNETIFYIEVDGVVLNEVKKTAENEFRKKVIEYLSLHYEESLGEYYNIWQKSGLNFDRQLINDIVKIGNSKVVKDNNKFRYGISLDLSDFNSILDKHRQQSLKNNDIFQRVDQFLSFPIVTESVIIDSLKNILQTLKIDYNPKYIVFQNDFLNIVLVPSIGFKPVVNFSYNQYIIEKMTDNKNEIILRVCFNNNNAKAKDVNINTTRSGSHIITFIMNYEKTFSIERLRNKTFFSEFFKSVGLHQYESIELLYLHESKFFVISENFPQAISVLHEVLHNRKWVIGTQEDYTHKIKINKIVEDEKQLNIGSFYIKGHLELQVYTKSNLLLNSIMSKSIEAIDNLSLENASRKLDKMLLESTVLIDF